MTRRTAGLLAWGLAAASTALGVVGLVLYARAEPGGNVALAVAAALVLVSFPLVGALIAARHPGNAVGWLLVGAAVVHSFSISATGYSTLGLGATPAFPGSVVAAWLSDVLWLPSLVLTSALLFLLFPDGRLPSRRWRPVLYVVVGAAAVTTLSIAFERTLYAHPDVEAPLAGVVPGGLLEVGGTIGFFTLLAGTLASVVAVGVRFRRSRGAERQQLKLFVFAALVVLLIDVPVNILEPGSEVLQAVSALALLAIPVSIGLAILRHGLYEIDVVINRTVVYGLLAAFVTVLYLGVVVGVGALVGSRGSLFLSIVATALIALLFQPARERARHFANRLVYGKRATPYELLSGFADRLGEAYSVEHVLPRMARLVVEGTGAARTRIWLRVGSRLRPAASWPAGDEPADVDADGDHLPSLPDADAAFPVRDRGELLGALTMVLRPGDALTPAQEKLLRDLAAQAGLILRNVRLFEELRASRQRLVRAQDEERRRLERNIHDGAQQQLVALAVKLRLLAAVAEKDGTKARRLAEELQSQAQETMEDLRDLARGIYPPLLQEKGLPAALQAQARKAAVPVSVDPDGVGRYPQDVEAAAYFCVLEALQNAAKYSEATSVRVSLRQENAGLAFRVEDDGRGFDAATTPRGSGLQNMADRLEALGGDLEIRSSPGAGTVVRGRVPIAGGTSA